MPKHIQQDPQPSPFRTQAHLPEVRPPEPIPHHSAPNTEAQPSSSLWSMVAPLAAQGAASYLRAHPGVLRALQGWGAKVDGFLHHASDFLQALGGETHAAPQEAAKPASIAPHAAPQEAAKPATPPPPAEPEPLPTPKADAVAGSAEAKPGHGEPSAAAAKPGEVSAQGEKTASDPKADPWREVLKGNTRLKLGDGGAAVAKMQSELAQAGFPVPPSGVFDAATQKAIQKFQHTYHIQTTGEMGPQTGNGLEEVVAWKGVQSGQHILKPGEQGPSVTMLQRQLLAAGYKVDLSGVYDDKTSALIKEVQRGKGWGPDGKVGPLTVGALKELQQDDSASEKPDAESHVPTDKTGRAVYQDNKARLQQMKVQLSKDQQYDMGLFLNNWDKNEARYDKVADQANMPPELIAALHWRESSGNFGTYLHQGDPLGKPPKHWPTNIPTFYKWEDAANHALHQQKEVQDMFHISGKTTDPAALASYSEYYNGLGYHYKDRPSPYVFSGTNQYHGGKYVADGHYSPTAQDSQLGTMAMISALREHEHKGNGSPPAPGPTKAGGDPQSNISLTMAAHPWLEDKPKPPLAPSPVSTPKPAGESSWSGPIAEPQTEAEKYAYYKHAIESSGGKFDSRPEQRNIVGVRGWMNGHPVDNVKDQYNDTLAVLWEDKLGKDHVHKYNATVDPGRFPQYYNPAGDANLMAGQYDYVLGDHKGHTALNQDQAVKVWRDGNKDGVRQKNEGTDTGWFGINVHAGGAEANVSNWSAGCQVIRGGWGGEPWQDFIGQMRADPDHRYKYTLIDGQNMPHSKTPDPSKQQGHG